MTAWTALLAVIIRMAVVNIEVLAYLYLIL